MTEYQLVESRDTVYRDGTIKLHTEEGFEGMRAAGRLAASILDEVADMVEPGITTASIDDRVREMTLDAGAVPATLGYRGYTHSCCISINHVICHGIPGSKVLKDGDIDLAITEAIKWRCVNAGQVCTAPKRFIID